MATLTFEGGINEQDVTLVQPQECISGWNFELGSKNTHWNPRKPFDHLGTATNAATIKGFVQLIKNDDTETTLVQSGDTVYEWDGTSTFTSRGTVNSSSKLRGVTWTLGGYSVITDISKATVVKKWDGSTLSTLTTGLGSDLYAKYAVVHLGRVWMFNVKAGTDTPHLLVASAFEDPTSYDTSKRSGDGSFSTGNEAFFMVTPNLEPINGVAVFQNLLLISTKSRVYKLTGSDSQDFAWVDFYTGSGATGTETMANIGNDVVYMKDGGNIDLMQSVQEFGDVRADDISRWIMNTVDGLTDCITVYDQKRQKVYFFCTSGELLVLFKDMLPHRLSPWSQYKTDNAATFTTNAAIYMRQPGGTDWFVYFGDTSGKIYQLDGTGSGDAGATDISSYRRTRFFDDIEGFNPETQRLRGRVYYRRVSDVDLVMDFEWGDDYAINQCTVPLDGPPAGDAGGYFGGSSYFGGAFYFNSGFFYADRVSTKGFSPVGRGVGFNLDLTITSSLSFDVMNIKV